MVISDLNNEISWTIFKGDCVVFIVVVLLIRVRHGEY